MSYIAIPIPTIPGKQDIEIDVTINGLSWPGQKQALHYRVELFYWSDCIVPIFDGVALHRVECIQQLLATYDQDWSLYYIGAPTDEFVPITFVRKGDIAKQRQLRQLA